MNKAKGVMVWFNEQRKPMVRTIELNVETNEIITYKDIEADDTALLIERAIVEFDKVIKLDNLEMMKDQIKL
jgi:tRNA G26 N,N-dimethylase Trm1